MPYTDKDSRPERGLCKQCPNPVKPFHRRCEKCLDVDRQQAKVRRKKQRLQWEKEGRCTDCGNELDADADNGRKSCINCRERGYNHGVY